MQVQVSRKANFDLIHLNKIKFIIVLFLGIKTV